MNSIDRLVFLLKSSSSIILQKLLPGVTEASDRILLEDALHRVQQQIAQHSCLAEHSCFGAGVASPQLSIVITLYASYDCIRQQLAAFSMDPFFKQCELVYVLDSPQHAVALKQLVRELSVLNNTSVTLAVMPANLGTASAINAGVAVARAPTLVIMDSDMLLPVNNAGHSWLEALHRLHEATTSPHVIIPAQKDAAQLAPQGVVAYRYEHDEVTLLTKDNAAKQKRPLPDGSCFSIAKKYFKKLGGIPAQDIVCGYERLAFMHRCAEAGIKPVILEKSAPMVHLGGMSANQHPSHSEVLQHINWRAHCLRWKKYIRQVANAPR